jgi:hypothetical protein
MRRPSSARSLFAVPAVWAALLAGAASAGGCASAPEESDNPAADAPVLRDVAATQLARELGLQATPASDGRVVLQAPGSAARILIFPGTRVATVAGRQIELLQPVSTSGGETWIAAGDAATIRDAWRIQVASGATRSVPSAAGGVRVPIPSAPESSPSPREASAPQLWVGDNRPSAAELAQWSVPIRRKWQYIVVHHSASPAGNAASIDRAHRDRGFDGLGYNFVIGNGTSSPDGAIEVGYRWKQQLVGAHAKTAGNFMNEHGIGICLVGDFTKTRPTAAQMRSLDRLCTFLAAYCGIPAENLRMHGEVKSTECPGKLFPRDFAIRVAPRGTSRVATVPDDGHRGTH